MNAPEDITSDSVELDGSDQVGTPAELDESESGLAEGDTDLLDDAPQVPLVAAPTTDDDVVNGVIADVVSGLHGSLEEHVTVFDAAHRALSAHLAQAQE